MSVLFPAQEPKFVNKRAGEEFDAGHGKNSGTFQKGIAEEI